MSVSLFETTVNLNLDFTVVATHVSHDGLRVLRFMLLFHCLHYRAELLAHQSLRRRDHQHILSHQERN